jgi:hypothetical protein
MNQTFWIGVYPGITPEMVGYVLDTFDAFFRQQRGNGSLGAARREFDPAQWPGRERPADDQLPDPSRALDRLPLV